MIRILLEHPRAPGNSGYVFEHILVMEGLLGRYLYPGRDGPSPQRRARRQLAPGNLELWVKPQPSGHPSQRRPWSGRSEMLCRYAGELDTSNRAPDGKPRTFLEVRGLEPLCFDVSMGLLRAQPVLMSRAPPPHRPAKSRDPDAEEERDGNCKKPRSARRSGGLIEESAWAKAQAVSQAETTSTRSRGRPRRPAPERADQEEAAPCAATPVRSSCQRGCQMLISPASASAPATITSGEPMTAGRLSRRAAPTRRSRSQRRDRGAARARRVMRVPPCGVARCGRPARRWRPARRP